MRILAEADGYQVGIQKNADGLYALTMRVVRADTAPAYYGEWEHYAASGVGRDQDDALILSRFAKRIGDWWHIVDEELAEMRAQHLSYTPDPRNSKSKDIEALTRKEAASFWEAAEAKARELTWKRRSYLISVNDGGDEYGSATLEGHVSGPFGISGTSSRGKGPKDIWEITHIPTGFKVGKKYPSLSSAKTLVAALLAPDIIWEFTTEPVPTDTKRRAGAIIKAYTTGSLPVTG